MFKPADQRQGRIRPLKNYSDPNRRGRIFDFLALIAVVGWLYIFFISDLFLINTIQVVGAGKIDTADVSREVLSVLDHRASWRPWPGRHAWFIDREALAQQLQTALFLEEALVDKSYTHILRLSIKERSQKLIFYSHQQYVWADTHGAVMDDLTPSERKDAQARILGSRPALVDDPPLVHHDLDERMIHGYRVADDLQVKQWVESTSQAMKAGFLYRELNPPGASSTKAIFITAQGDKVFVDLAAPLEPQFKGYLTFKKYQPKDLKVTEYVDVRIPGKVFVK
ncbi:hypothetical protein EXS71_03115 [Candidatus Uhrbacteria bacterium]|nr:hypothetical protein [Candidatus Uhrbacteria bacterium]